MKSFLYRSAGPNQTKYQELIARKWMTSSEVKQGRPIPQHQHSGFLRNATHVCIPHPKQLLQRNMSTMMVSAFPCWVKRLPHGSTDRHATRSDRPRWRDRFACRSSAAAAASLARAVATAQASDDKSCAARGVWGDLLRGVSCRCRGFLMRNLGSLSWTKTWI